MLQIKKIKLIALAMLLLAGITGGQVWGMENLQSYEQWIDSNDPDARNYKKQIADKKLWKQKNLQDLCKVNKILEDIIKNPDDTKLFEKISPFSLEANVDQQDNSTGDDQCLTNIVKSSFLNLMKKISKMNDSEKKVQYSKWTIGVYQLLTQRQNLSDKNDNDLAKLEIARRACFEKKEQEKKQQNINRSYITLICSFIGGIISSFKFGTGLANENKNGLLGVVKNNWKPFGFGTAITCGTTAYSYKKIDKRYCEASLVTVAGLVGHTLGMATGLVTGYGVKKLKDFSCYR